MTGSERRTKGGTQKLISTKVIKTKDTSIEQPNGGQWVKVDNLDQTVDSVLDERKEHSSSRKIAQSKGVGSATSLAYVSRRKESSSDMQHETPQSRQIRRKKESENLLKYAADHNLSIEWSPPVDIEPINIGQEHTVWLGEDNYVYKITKKNHQGLTLVQDEYGDAKIVQATPSEYFDRVAMQNRYFADDSEIIGFKVLGDIVHIATKQSYIHGTPPTDREIEVFMKNGGYTFNRSELWENDEVLIADAHTGNFIKTTKGELVPIDLIVVSKKSIGL